MGSVANFDFFKKKKKSGKKFEIFFSELKKSLLQKKFKTEALLCMI